MTVAQEFYNWVLHQPEQDPTYDRCSPNLIALRYETTRLFHMTDNGCYVERDIRGGSSPSAHSHGAANDRNYPNRDLAIQQIIPWLIANSHELGLQAIHDYFGCRIWRAGRIGDPYTDWWRAQTPSSKTGMGQSWALYFHLETNRTQWGNSTPIAERLGGIVLPPPIPPSGALVFPRTIKPGDTGPDVAAVQVGIRAPGNAAGNKNVIVDGNYGPQTVDAVKAMQRWWGLTPDGWIGPKTQAKFMLLFNS